MQTTSLIEHASSGDIRAGVIFNLDHPSSWDVRRDFYSRIGLCNIITDVDLPDHITPTHAYRRRGVIFLVHGHHRDILSWYHQTMREHPGLVVSAGNCATQEIRDYTFAYHADELLVLDRSHDRAKEIGWAPYQTPREFDGLLGWDLDDRS